MNDSPHPIRVLVVDGSAFTRVALTRMIESDPALCVTETAQNGREALEKIASLHPDVVTLDIEMPGTNSNVDNSDWYGFGWAERGEGNTPRGRNHTRLHGGQHPAACYPVARYSATYCASHSSSPEGLRLSFIR